MLRAITVTNFKGESLRMELSKPEDSGLLIYNITGLGSPSISINNTDMATVDGGRFNSARAQVRNIVFTLAFVEQTGIPSEPGDYTPGIGSGSSGTREELDQLKERVAKLEIAMPVPIPDYELDDIIAETVTNPGGESDAERS